MKRLNITTIIIICNIIITRMMGSWISRRMMGSSVARPGYQSQAEIFMYESLFSIGYPSLLIINVLTICIMIELQIS